MDKIDEKETSDIQNYLASFNKEIQDNDLEDEDSENENCDDRNMNNEAFYTYASRNEVKFIFNHLKEI